MAWMLCGLEIEPVALALSGAKATGSMVAGYLLKRVWRGVMGTGEVKQCMISGCGAVASQYRGLCLRCYSKAKEKVNAGLTSWEDLATMGLCEGAADPFTKAFNEAKEQS